MLVNCPPVYTTNATTHVFTMLLFNSKLSPDTVPITNVSRVAVKYALVMPRLKCTLIMLTPLGTLVSNSLSPTIVQTNIAESQTGSTYTYPKMLEYCLYIISICNCLRFIEYVCAEILAIISIAHPCAYQNINSWCNPVFQLVNTTCSYTCWYQMTKMCLLPFVHFTPVHCGNPYVHQQCRICLEPCEHMSPVKNWSCDIPIWYNAKALSVFYQVGNSFAAKLTKWRVKHYSP
jgi:hypothetical protein